MEYGMKCRECISYCIFLSEIREICEQISRLPVIIWEKRHKMKSSRKEGERGNRKLMEKENKYGRRMKK